MTLSLFRLTEYKEILSHSYSIWTLGLDFADKIWSESWITSTGKGVVASANLKDLMQDEEDFSSLDCEFLVHCDPPYELGLGRSS